MTEPRRPTDAAVIPASTPPGSDNSFLHYPRRHRRLWWQRLFSLFDSQAAGAVFGVRAFRQVLRGV